MRRAVQLVSLGRYLPPRIVQNHELAAALSLSPDALFARSGVRTRRRADVPAGETASFMGAEAAKDALRAAELAPHQIDLILNASGTPEQAVPDNGPLIQRALGLGGSGIASMSVHATCLSFVAALDIAASLIVTERYRRILIVSTEVTSTGLDFGDPETAPLFGDAAAAAIVTRAEHPGQALHCVRIETYGEGAELTQIAGCGSRRAPNTPSTTARDNVFGMRGGALLKLTAKRARPFLARLAEDEPRTAHPDALLVPHQPSAAGMRMYEALGYAPARTVSTLAELGNCVAASIPLSLHAASAAGRLTRGRDVLLLGTSAGVSFGGALLTF